MNINTISFILTPKFISKILSNRNPHFEFQKSLLVGDEFSVGNGVTVFHAAACLPSIGIMKLLLNTNLLFNNKKKANKSKKNSSERVLSLQEVVDDDDRVAIEKWYERELQRIHRQSEIETEVL